MKWDEFEEEEENEEISEGDRVEDEERVRRIMMKNKEKPSTWNSALLALLHTRIHRRTMQQCEFQGFSPQKCTVDRRNLNTMNWIKLVDD